MQDTEKTSQSARYVLESIYPSRRMMEELKRLQKVDHEEQVSGSVIFEAPVISRNALKNRIMKTLRRNLRH